MANLLLLADDAVLLTAASYRNGGLKDPNDDLSGYGSGRSFVRADHRMRRQSFANNWSGLRSQNYAFLGGVPQIAFASAKMQRGEVLPTMVDTSIGIASFPGLSAVMRPAARFLTAGLFGQMGVAGLSGMLAVLPAYGVGKIAAQGVRYFKDWGYNLRRIEMGGRYEDTDTASSLRMRAINDMSSALSYSRRWLGNEASFMR